MKTKFFKNPIFPIILILGGVLLGCDLNKNISDEDKTTVDVTEVKVDEKAPQNNEG